MHNLLVVALMFSLFVNRISRLHGEPAVDTFVPDRADNEVEQRFAARGHEALGVPVVLSPYQSLRSSRL